MWVLGTESGSPGRALGVLTSPASKGELLNGFTLFFLMALFKTFILATDLNFLLVFNQTFKLQFMNSMAIPSLSY